MRQPRQRALEDRGLAGSSPGCESLEPRRAFKQILTSNTFRDPCLDFVKVYRREVQGPRSISRSLGEPRLGYDCQLDRRS